MAANAPQIVNVIGQDGGLHGVPSQHLDAVLRSGEFRIASPDETAAYWKQQDYGGAGQGAAAFGEGALSAATFGAGPKIEEFLGATPEGIAGRKEVHPIAHGAGEVAGVLAPLALTGGAAAPAAAGAATAEAAPGILGAARTAAEFTAPALISRAGRAVQAATEGMLPGAVGRVLPAAALGATEGALYSGSDVMERKLLGDPGLTMEKAIAEVGVGALFGGALGGAAKGLSELMPDSLAESMADKLGTTAGNRNLKAAAGPGGSKAIIRRLQRQHGEENLTRMGQEMGDLGLVGPLTSPEHTFEAAQALKGTAGEEMGAILDAADAARAPGLASGIARDKNGAPMLDAAFRDAKTGRIIATGPYHDINALPGGSAGLADLTDAGWQSGFVERKTGKFLTREQAADGVYGNHVEGGLDSGDLAGADDVAKDLYEEAPRRAVYIDDSDLPPQSKTARAESSLPTRAASVASAPSAKDVIGRARQEILYPLTENPLEQGTARQLGEVLNGYEDKYADGMGFRDLHDIRKQVSDKIYGLRGTQDPAGTAFKDALHDFRSLISDEINTGLEKTGLTSDAWKAANRKYAVASVAEKLAEDGKLKHTGNNLLSLTEIMAGLTGAASHGIGLGGLAAMGTHFAREHASGIIGWAATAAQRRLLSLAAASDKSLSSAVDAIFSEAAPSVAGAKAAEKVGEGRVSPERFGNVSSVLRDYGGDTDKLAETVSKETAALQNHAPGAADAAHALAARMVQHLNTQIPHAPDPAPLSNAYKPSVAELVPFNRAQEIAHQPMRVLHHIARGTLDRVHVATAETIWPKLTAEMRTQLTEKLAEAKAAGRSIPRRSRLALSMFLGSDLDRSTMPAVIAAHQASFRNAPGGSAPTALGGGGGSPRGGGKASAIKSAGTFATAAQRSEGRDGRDS